MTQTNKDIEKQFNWDEHYREFYENLNWWEKIIMRWYELRIHIFARIYHMTKIDIEAWLQTRYEKKHGIYDPNE